MRQRTLGVVLIAVGLVGLIGTAWALASRPDGYFVASGAWAPLGGGGVPTCDPPALPGQTVDVVLSDMGGMMSGARMMSVAASPSSIPAGQVSLHVWNAGMMDHEIVVLPLLAGGAGTRAVGSDGRGLVATNGTITRAGPIESAQR